MTIQTREPINAPWSYKTVQHADGFYYSVFDVAGQKICDCKTETMVRLISSAPILLEILKESQEHHDYCGYGDSWEREVAGDLDERITAAITGAEPLQQEKAA